MVCDRANLELANCFNSLIAKPTLRGVNSGLCHHSSNPQTSLWSHRSSCSVFPTRDAVTIDRDRRNLPSKTEFVVSYHTAPRG